MSQGYDVPPGLPAACTWVPIEQSGKSVQVLPAGPVPAGCQQQGEVVVSVKSKVGFYNRNPLRVQEELETLARNEAPSAGANAVQATCGIWTRDNWENVELPALARWNVAYRMLWTASKS